jgi:acetylornithine deacetylase/succinyl-diaminopimelate desuccinylase-like protein
LKPLFDYTRSPAFAEDLKQLLLSLCRVDTTPHPKVERMRSAESRCFDLLEHELQSLSFAEVRTERRPINPRIQEHPFYSLLHFTKTRQRPEGLSADAAYRGRSNLLCFLPGRKQSGPGKSVALNAHIDVVAPYFPPAFSEGTIRGRGACDDKGPVVSIVGALRAMCRFLEVHDLPLQRGITAMFVIEEETGGNGSLSLAIDRKLRQHYDSVIVGECTGLKVHPANRGAVWYSAHLTAPP